MSETKDIILKAEGISKQYRLGLVGTGTLKDDLNRWWHKVRGKEDPFLKIGDNNDRSIKGESNYVWALKDINFQVKKGEVLGIIGKNGAGKSTLLKILSRVTSPTTGEIKSKGRIASLLEVGTGFHPEMTGRENIYLNGAILGMTKSEIKAKEEEIIDFSGCAGYIDTPVKRYSSGMRVRLGFAVAAHLEPDILVIDEVLAVGDAEFQKKAISKMQDISKGEGRTVLFVSHNMAAVRNLCTRAIVLENGKTVFEGNTHEGVEFYLKNDINKKAFFKNLNPKSNSDIMEVYLTNYKNEKTQIFGFQDKIHLHVGITVSDIQLPLAVLGFRVIDQLDRTVFSSQIYLRDYLENSGRNLFKIELPFKTLVPNEYKITVGFHIPNQEIIRRIESAVSFKIEETGTDFHLYAGKDYGCVLLDCNWNLID